MEVRRLGRGGPVLPVLGLGGQATFERGSIGDCEVLFDAVVGSGIIYVDTAHDYGPSQERLGSLMRLFPGRKFFVASKTGKRDRDDFMRELDENLHRLQRNLDLLHIHAVQKGEAREICRSGGALEAVLEAKERGYCRFVGLTSHASPDDLWEILRWNPGAIDVVMVALSAADTRCLDKLVPWCRERGVGVVAMKVMGRGMLVRPDGPGIRSGVEALRFVLSCPVDLAIVGFTYPEEVRELAASVVDFRSMSSGELLDREMGTLSYAQDVWFYKDEVGGWGEVHEARPSPGWYVPWMGPS